MAASTSAAAVFLHYEEHEPFHTMKLSLQSDTAITVESAILAFVESYSTATGTQLQAMSLSLCTDAKALLEPSWVLPCGLVHQSDLFVTSVPAGAGAVAPPAAGVAVEGGVSAVVASQSKLGEASYYYSVNKNLGNTVHAPEPQVPRAKHAVANFVRTTTITSFTMIDDDARVKVHIPMARTQQLPSNGVAVGFYDRSMRVAVRPDASSEHSLNLPLLLEEIDQQACSVKVKDGKLIVFVAKREADKVWYELRKTKGVGDTEYDKLVPWTGQVHVVTTGGSAPPLPEASIPDGTKAGIRR